jgi:hypothetical protein
LRPNGANIDARLLAAGIYGIMEETGKQVFKKRVPDDLKEVLAALEQYRKGLLIGFHCNRILKKVD